MHNQDILSFPKRFLYVQIKRGNKFENTKS